VVDAVAIFPLVMLGIQQIIDKGKPWLYCVSLAVTLFSNYYMGYMVCIFSVIYFFVYYFSHNKFNERFVEKYRYDITDSKTAFIRFFNNSKLFRTALRFAFFSLLAGMLAAVSLIPVYFALKACSATSGVFPVEYKSYFKIFDFLTNHLAGLTPTIRSSGEDVLPNIYCGILTLILIPLYLLNKKISIKEKAIHIVLLVFFLLSFNINYLNYIWHGFHFPNDLPYRFSFIYSFILLIMAYKAFVDLKDYSSKNFLIIGICVMAFVVVTEKEGAKNVNELSLWISIAFCAAYTLILALFKNKNYSQKIVALLLLCTCASEIAVANTGNYVMSQSHTNYLANYNDFVNVDEHVKKQDNSWYRLEQSNLLTRMDNSWYNYNGSSTFSSMAYEKLSNVMRDLGFMGNYINSYTYHPQTAVFNSMFDIKYVYDNDYSINNDDLYESVCGNDTYQAYRNKYTLPLVFGANKEVKNWYTSSTVSPFVLQEDLFSSASGVSGVFEDIPISYVSYNNIHEFYPDEIKSGHLNVNKQNSSDGASFTLEITVPKDENVYFYLKSRNVKSVTAKGDFIEKSQNMDRNFNIIDLGKCHEGETIYIEAMLDEDSGDETVSFYAAGLNLENFIKGYEALSKNALQNVEVTDTSVKGTVNVQKDGVLFTTIPYDEGWSVLIDGEKADYYAISEAFIGLDISSGKHTVEFRFKPKGFLTGVLITSASLVLLIALAVISSKSKKIRKICVDKWWKYDNSVDAQFLEQAKKEESEIKKRITKTSVFDSFAENNEPPENE